jgi:CRP-like cAMP-binding protein
MWAIEKVSVLRSLEVFRTIPEEHLGEVAAVLKERQFRAGETIIREGDMGTSMFILIDGRVWVHRNDVNIAVLGSGDIFGELAALDRGARTASVTSMTDVVLLELDGTALYGLMSTHVELVRGLIRILCNRVRSNLPN